MATVPADLDQVTSLRTSGLVSGQSVDHIADHYTISRALQAVRALTPSLSVAGHTHTTDDVTDMTSITRTFNKSATVAAARTAIGAQPAGDYATLVSGKVPASQLPTTSGGTATTSASDLTSGTLALARLAGGVPVIITKSLAETSPASHSANAWPTARPSLPSGVRVIFVGDTDPGLVSGLRADGDLWFRA